MISGTRSTLGPRRWTALALIALLLVPAACRGGEPDPQAAPAPAPPAAPAPPSPPPPEEVGSDEELYAVPPEVADGAAGTLARFQPLEAPPAMKGWRILYRSRAIDGRPVLVSGLVFAPAEPAEAGSRPVVAWGHGSVGLGDKCAPSRVQWSLARQSMVARLVDAGFVVTATDYEGLGTPGPHPWLVGESEGRSVLDSVRAAGHLPGAGAGKRFIALGGSQGGGAVLFAGELAPDYAPELQLLGVAALAPAAELDLLASLPPQGAGLNTAFFVMGVFGFAAAYPHLPIDALLPPEVIAAREDIEASCQTELDRRFRGVRVTDLLKATPGQVQPWAEALVTNTPGRRPTPAPVLLVHGDVDRVVPPQVSQLLFQRLCGLGVKTELQLYEGAGHIDVFGVSSADVLEWVGERAAGEPLSPREGAQSCL